MRSLFLLTICFSQVLIGAEITSVISQFEKLVEKQREEWHVPGIAIGIVKDGKVILTKGFGQRGVDSTEPVDENTLFQIGSLSKAFTTTLMAMGVDTGLFEWSNPVWELDPEFSVYDPWVTREFQVVDLFCQRSGLPPLAGDVQLFLGFNQEEILHNLHLIPPITSFRSAYAYQNVFFIEGAKLLEKKMGSSYQQLLQKKIFTPLKMHSTSVTLEDYLKSPNKADWVERDEKGRFRTIPFEFKGNEWSYTAAPAGGINSTAKDMSQWLIFQTNLGTFENTQLVSKKELQKTHEPFIATNNLGGIPAYYCLGWVYLQYAPYPIILHTGATLGVHNTLGIIPEERLGIVILTNGRGAELSTALLLQFFDLYYEKNGRDWNQFFLEKLTTHPPTAQTYTPTDLTQYEGVYSNPMYGEANVKLEGKHLVLTLGKNNADFFLTPQAENLFTFDWFPVEVDPINVAFSIDFEGKISQMRIDIIEESGGGIFTSVEHDQNP